MRLRPILFAAAVISVAGVSSTGFAQTPAPPGGLPRDFQSGPQAGPEGAVTVRQGRLGGMGGGMGALPRSRNEVEPWADRTFTRLDANTDGAITGDELAVLSQEPVASLGGGRLRALISRSDANRDARVSQDEFRAGALRAFDRMDANGDGQLSDEEAPRPAAPSGPVAIPMPSAPNPMPMTLPPPDGTGG
jgi:hypothetical protein